MSASASNWGYSKGAGGFVPNNQLPVSWINMASPLPGGRGWDVVGALTAIITVTTIAFSLRVYVRLRLVKRSSEDWAAGVAYLLYLAFFGVTVQGPFHGIGQHTHLVPVTEFSTALKFYWYTELTYALTNLAVKTSIALMLLRYVVDDFHRKLIYIITGTGHMVSIIAFFFVVFQCMPVSFYWTRVLDGTKGQCVTPSAFLVMGAAYSFANLSFYWMTAIIPWLIVRKTQLDFQTRLMVGFVLASASAASIAIIVRVPYFLKLRQNDFLYTYADLVIWSFFEPGLAISASSAAMLRPLFRKNASQSGSRGWAQPKLNLTYLTSCGSGAAANVTNNTQHGDVELSKV